MTNQIFRIFAVLACLALAGCAEDWGPDQRGETVTAKQLEGQWLLINYWAEWCGPCRTEIPELNLLDQSKDDVTVLGVNFDGLTGDELASAAKTMNIDFRILSVDPSERLDLPRSGVLPVTYIVSPEGEVKARLVGEQTAQGLQEQLARLKTE